MDRGMKGRWTSDSVHVVHVLGGISCGHVGVHCKIILTFLCVYFFTVKCWEREHTQAVGPARLFWTLTVSFLSSLCLSSPNQKWRAATCTFQSHTRTRAHALGALGPALARGSTCGSLQPFPLQTLGIWPRFGSVRQLEA